MSVRPTLIEEDYSIAEEVIRAWCECGDHRTTRTLIAEGVARARIAYAGKVPTVSLTNAWDDIIRSADQIASARG